MKYVIEPWNIRKLIELHESKNLDLSPPYQRGDIWPTASKKKLIDSIKSHYPLPAFFIYKKEDGKFEMVDGQQRTRAILGYHEGFFSDDNKINIEHTDKPSFYENYKIAVTIITDATEKQVVDFYYRVNKFGTKLNRPEIARSHYHSLHQLDLVKRISNSESFESLGLFSDASLNRLNDEDMVAELLTLHLFGITDKKNQVDDKFYGNEAFSEEQARSLEEEFNEILSVIERFDDIYPLRKTRYKQRNDIYTLYDFIKANIKLGNDTLDYFYKLLVLIGEDIYPSNDKCFPLKEYADNCVSQSNSKKAREGRLNFLNQFLLNKDSDPIGKDEDDLTINLVMLDILVFYKLNSSDLIKINDFYPIDVDKLQNALSKPYFQYGIKP